mgnify:CR=1 FL=1
MLKKLRSKFIIVSMAAVTCVLAIIMLAVNLTNYVGVASDADGMLDLLYANDGTLFRPDLPGGDRKPPGNFDNAETPYETRYFTVRFLSGVTLTNVNYVAAISEEEAVDLARSVAKNNAERGYTGTYRYLSTDDDTFILFLDCRRQLEIANGFLLSSFVYSAIGLVAVFALVLVFSKVALKPVKDGYEKQKRFITDASHELKTPLTIISANNEITEMTTGETKATKAISKQVEKMSVMIKNLTTLASLSENEKVISPQRINFDGLVKDVSEYFRPAICVKERTFTVDCEQNVTVRGDEKLLRQTLSTLLENASKYSLSKVFLTLKNVGKNAVLTVGNDAEGVPDGNLDRVFERFYRSDTARSGMIAGNGIGLSIAKSIVSSHGGTISAKGVNGEFIVTVTLPC